MTTATKRKASAEVKRMARAAEKEFGVKLELKIRGRNTRVRLHYGSRARGEGVVSLPENHSLAESASSISWAVGYLVARRQQRHEARARLDVSLRKSTDRRCRWFLAYQLAPAHRRPKWYALEDRLVFADYLEECGADPWFLKVLRDA